MKDVSQHTRIAVPSPSDYLAVMSRAVFQAGLSWAQIDRQWAALCDAFDGFDPKRVAAYRAADVRRIMRHPGILHSERKVKATIANAKTLLALSKPRGFRHHLRSFGRYDAVVADLKASFSFVGDISAYYFLYRVGEKVPPFGRWIKTVEGEHPRIAQMAKRKKR